MCAHCMHCFSGSIWDEPLLEGKACFRGGPGEGQLFLRMTSALRALHWLAAAQRLPTPFPVQAPAAPLQCACCRCPQRPCCPCAGASGGRQQQDVHVQPAGAAGGRHHADAAGGRGVRRALRHTRAAELPRWGWAQRSLPARVHVCRLPPQICRWANFASAPALLPLVASQASQSL